MGSSYSPPGGANLVPLTGPAAGTVLEATRVQGDTFDRWQKYADGSEKWGPGNAALDNAADLYYAGLSQLKMDGSLYTVLALRTDSDTITRVGTAAETRTGARGPAAEAGISFGSAADAMFYRRGVGQMGIRPATTVGDTLTVNGEQNNIHIRNSSDGQDCGIVGRNPADAGMIIGGNVTLTLGTNSGPTKFTFGNTNGSGTERYRLDANGHPIALQAAPTPSILAASTGVSLDANGHDEAGQVNVTPANAVAADTAVVRVSFANAYASAPVIVLTPVNGASAKVQPFVTNVGTGAFDIAIHVPDAVAVALKFAYRVVGVS